MTNPNESLIQVEEALRRVCNRYSCCEIMAELVSAVEPFISPSDMPVQTLNDCLQKALDFIRNRHNMGRQVREKMRLEILSMGDAAIREDAGHIGTLVASPVRSEIRLNDIPSRDAEALIMALRDKVKTIPMGEENIHKGSSPYNWGKYYISVLEDLLVDIYKKSPKRECSEISGKEYQETIDRLYAEIDKLQRRETSEIRLIEDAIESASNSTELSERSCREVIEAYLAACPVIETHPVSKRETSEISDNKPPAGITVVPKQLYQDVYAELFDTAVTKESTADSLQVRCGRLTSKVMKHVLHFWPESPKREMVNPSQGIGELLKEAFFEGFGIGDVMAKEKTIEGFWAHSQAKANIPPPLNNPEIEGGS